MGNQTSNEGGGGGVSNPAGFESGVDYRVEEVYGLRNVFFSGQRLINICLTEPGHIWVESQPQHRLIRRINCGSCEGGIVIEIMRSNS
jgi:hypothetical protein